MGDSITYYWTLPRTNLGIPGDTTVQMLARFQSEVLGHGNKAVVILGGSNDMRNLDFTVNHQVTQVVTNLGAMVELAESEKLLVVLCTIPPISGQDARVQALNVAITSFANAHKYKLVDYYTPMAGHPEYFKDGIHPNDIGYNVMQTALTKVIQLDY
jgi:lysophospholipase L1-like esterase